MIHSWTPHTQRQENLARRTPFGHGSLSFAILNSLLAVWCLKGKGLEDLLFTLQFSGTNVGTKSNCDSVSARVGDLQHETILYFCVR